MNVLLIVNSVKDVDFKVASEVIDFLKSKQLNIYCDDQSLMNKFNLLRISDEELNNISFSLIIGGDGTVLKYASKYAECKFPFVGINLGRVGALTILELDNYKKYVEKILDNDYDVIEHIGLLCTINYNEKEENVSFIGYNDIILHRGSSLKLLPIMIGVNENKKDLFFADGMVVATPNGSSAYNVSAGGPLLSHSCNSYVVTPICPQSKSFTPLVVSNSDIINLSLSNKSDIEDNEVTISADGCYKYFVSPLDKISIRKSESGLKMIRFNEVSSVYETVYKAVASIEKKGEK